jgi:predicted Zn-dependent protease
MAVSRMQQAVTAAIIVALSGFSSGLSQAQNSAAGGNVGNSANASNAASNTASNSANTGRLPNLGDGNDMAVSDEKRLGDRIAREIYRDPDYIDDPVLMDYVQGIWQPLLAAARLRGDLSPELSERFAWEIMLGKDRSVNAFALPGGYFGLHLGLLAVVGNRDELASVLGHELSHVTQRHISRAMAKQGAQSPWLLGAMILGVLAASKNIDAANALVVGGHAVAAQNQLNFSRDMEREADRVGYGVMTQAGFAPQGFVSMFDKLQQASRHNDSGSYPYLRSHPLTTERIADMQARLPAPPASAGVNAGSSASNNVATTLQHAMLTARAQVLSNSSVDALRAWAPLVATAGLGSQPPGTSRARQAGHLYGAALAAMKLRDFDVALQLSQRLITWIDDTPHSPARAQALRLAGLLEAEIALAEGSVAGAQRAARAIAANTAGIAAAQAQAALNPAVRGKFPEKYETLPPQTGRPDVLLQAAADVRIGRPAAAAAALQEWLATHPRDAQAWQLLSAAYAAQGQALRAIRADAESHVAVLDYAPAQDRFKAAQDLAREQSKTNTVDHIEASIIDTRVRELASLLREQALER